MQVGERTFSGKCGGTNVVQQVAAYRYFMPFNARIKAMRQHRRCIEYLFEIIPCTINILHIIWNNPPRENHIEYISQRSISKNRNHSYDHHSNSKRHSLFLQLTKHSACILSWAVACRPNHFFYNRLRIFRVAMITRVLPGNYWAKGLALHLTSLHYLPSRCVRGEFTTHLTTFIPKS